MRLVDQRNVLWQNRAQFFGIAGQLRRRILVDHARSKQAEKRGGEDVKLQLDEAMMVGRSKNVDLVALEKALMALAELDERQSKIVGLRYFSGLSIEETAEALGISHATVKRDWAMRRRGCIGN